LSLRGVFVTRPGFVSVLYGACQSEVFVNSRVFAKQLQQRLSLHHRRSLSELWFPMEVPVQVRHLEKHAFGSLIKNVWFTKGSVWFIQGSVWLRERMNKYCEAMFGILFCEVCVSQNIFGKNPKVFGAPCPTYTCLRSRKMVDSNQ
jgi:hypothetical protein